MEFDGLRAIAILLVVGSHYAGFADLARRIPELGWIGVDIFFALSGYLITAILLAARSRRNPYRTFYSRRMVRILPPYLAVTLILLVIGLRQHWHIAQFLTWQILFLQALPQEGRSFYIEIFRHSWHYISHLRPLLANAHKLPIAGVGLPMEFRFSAIPYWSLSVEEYFYILWAPIILSCSRKTVVRLTVLICLAEMVLRWIVGDFTAYFLLPCRFDSILYGALLAILFEHWKERGIPNRASSFFAAVMLAAGAGIAFILYEIHPILGREIRSSPLCLVFALPLLSILIAALIGVLKIHTGTKFWLARVLRNKLLLFIGTISYTMYLVHAIVGSAVAGVVRLGVLHLSETAEALVSLSLTIVAAYLSWHLLEKPLLRWKDRRFPSIPHASEPALD